MKKHLFSLMFACAGIGMGVFGLFAYCLHHPEWTAFTHTAPMASSTALAVIALGLAVLLRQ